MSTLPPSVPSGQTTPAAASVQTSKPARPAATAQASRPPKEQKPPRPKADGGESKKDSKPPAQVLGGGEANLTPKQLKELKKAEKQARRAAEKSASGAPPGGKPDQPIQDKKGKTQQDGPKKNQGPKADVPKRTEKAGPAGRPAKSSGQQQGASSSTTSGASPVQEKEIALFKHFDSPSERRFTVAGAHKDVHPAILSLALHMASYVICGSSARCVATMLALKRVIEDYNVPLGTSLPRHLNSHHLTYQIDHLKSARPMSISMKNAIKWLKMEISQISIDLSEEAAKELLIQKIDNFLREKITVAGKAIVTSGVDKIVDGDVILTYAKSTVVQNVLAEAHRRGKSFRVIVVDSRPLFEGKQMCKALTAIGIDCTYSLTHSLAHVIRNSTKVFLGAHAMLGNGRLASRVGTALAAMYAKEFEIPVIVFCESIKFTDKVGLDSIVTNELGSPDELVNMSMSRDDPKAGKLLNWRDTANLHLLNVMYDVTPAENITLVITEHGSLPPSSVPVVYRFNNPNS